MPKKIVIDGIIGWDVYPSTIRKELENSKEEIEIEISSPGGSVFDGFEIFNLIQDYSKNINKVDIVVTSLAASIASYIAVAGDTLSGKPNGTVMIHNAWSPAVGDHREMRARADILEQLSNIIAKAYSKKTGKGVKEIQDLMNNETWLIGENMQKSGFVDKIINDDDEIRNLDENLLLAKGRFENCISVMEKSAKSKNDLQKVAALITEFSKEESVIIKPELPQNNLEVKNNMDEKLQARINELEAENKSLKNDLENVQAHLEYADIAPTEVMKAIKDKEEFSAKVHTAKYGKIQLNAQLTNSRELDNVGDTNTAQGSDGDTKAATEKYIAEFKARRGRK
jgi:ATP-dependent protease ClpP protease subunit